MSNSHQTAQSRKALSIRMGEIEEKMTHIEEKMDGVKKEFTSLRDVILSHYQDDKAERVERQKITDRAAKRKWATTMTMIVLVFVFSLTAFLTNSSDLIDLVRATGTAIEEQK